MKLNNIVIRIQRDKKAFWLTDRLTEKNYRVLLKERYGEQFSVQRISISSDCTSMTLKLSEDRDTVICPYCANRTTTIFRSKNRRAYDIYQLEDPRITPNEDEDFVFHAPFVVKVMYQHPLYRCMDPSCKKIFSMPQTFTYSQKSHFTNNFAAFIRHVSLFGKQGETGGETYRKVRRLLPEGYWIQRSTFYSLGGCELRRRSVDTNLKKKQFHPPYMLDERDGIDLTVLSDDTEICAPGTAENPNIQKKRNSLCIATHLSVRRVNEDESDDLTI